MGIMTKLIGGQLLGANIKRIRLECGLTQEQTVAKMQVLGSPISRSTYSLIEMGRGNLFVSDLVCIPFKTLQEIPPFFYF